MIDGRELLTTHQAAEELKVSVQTIHRWATANPPRLPEAKKLGGLRGARLFWKSDVDALLTEAAS